MTVATGVPFGQLASVRVGDLCLCELGMLLFQGGMFQVGHQVQDQVGYQNASCWCPTALKGLWTRTDTL